MKTNDALQLIEQWQKQMCYVAQSVILRTKTSFDHKTIDAAKEFAEKSIHGLGAIKEEIYRFIQGNEKVTTPCNYKWDKPISSNFDNGDIAGAKYRLTNVLSLVKNSANVLSVENIISAHDNRRFQKTERFIEECGKLDKTVENFISVLSGAQVLKTQEIEKETVAEEKAPELEPVINKTEEINNSTEETTKPVEEITEAISEPIVAEPAATEVKEETSVKEETLDQGPGEETTHEEHQ